MTFLKPTLQQYPLPRRQTSPMGSLQGLQEVDSPDGEPLPKSAWSCCHDSTLFNLVSFL